MNEALKFVHYTYEDYYDRVYSIEDMMPIVCLDSEIDVGEVFKEL